MWKVHVDITRTAMRKFSSLDGDGCVGCYGLDGGDSDKLAVRDDGDDSGYGGRGVVGDEDVVVAGVGGQYGGRGGQGVEGGKIARVAAIFPQKMKETFAFAEPNPL